MYYEHIRQAADRARDDARRDPGDFHLANNADKLGCIAALCRTLGVAVYVPQGFIPAKDPARTGVDARCSSSSLVDEPRASFTPADACVPERGRASVEAVSSRHTQLSLDLE